MKKSTKKVKESTAASRQTEDGAIKEITPKKRKKGRYILIYLAIIGFVFYAVITIINQNVQIAEKKAELTDLQQQISVKSWNANDTPTTIELTFVNGNKQYTVKRNPEYERKKARGNGFTKQSAGGVYIYGSAVYGTNSI